MGSTNHESGVNRFLELTLGIGQDGPKDGLIAQSRVKGNVAFPRGGQNTRLVVNVGDFMQREQNGASHPLTLPVRMHAHGFQIPVRGG